MKRLLAIALATFSLAPLASAQPWAKAKLDKSPRHGEFITVTHDGRSISCFVV